MAGVSVESYHIVVLRSPRGRLGSVLYTCKCLRRMRGGFHRYMHISTCPQPDIGPEPMISAKDVRLSNVVDRTGIVSRTVAEGIVPVRRRLAFRELSIVDVGRLGNEVPFLRPADGAISIAMDRRVSDGAVVSTSFDVHIPQRGAGVFHLALASLPVSTIVSLKLRVGDQSPLR